MATFLIGACTFVAGFWCGGTIVGWAVRRRLSERGYDLHKVLGIDR